MPLKLLLAATSVALVLGAVGCSETESPNQLDAGSATSVDETDDSASGSDSSTTTETASAGDPSTTVEGDAKGNCPTQAFLDEVGSKVDVQAVFTGVKFAAQIVAGLDALDPYMPAKYDSDLALIRQTYLAFGQSTEGIDPRELTPEQRTQYEQANESLRSPEMEAATQHTQDFWDTNCPELDFG